MQDAMGVDDFANSDEAFASDALFESYRSGDPAEVKRCIETHQIFLELDNQVGWTHAARDLLHTWLVHFL